MTSGSPVWQMAFLAGALLIVLIEVLRGWRLGVVRQLVRAAALVLAYAAALFGSAALLPILRPFFKAPNIIISAMSGAVLALIVYIVVATVGAVLFKRTSQQKSGPIRWFYGISGALLGIFFGAFTVWLFVIGIRALGAIAEAQVQSKPPPPSPPPLFASRRPVRNPALSLAVSSPNNSGFVETLAKLKHSIELGPVGEAVKTADVVPDSAYAMLTKVGEICSNPKSAERFLSYPGAKALTENPKIVALRNDPEILRLIQEGRIFDLLQNPRIIAAANDPGLAAQLRSFQFQKALDYAVGK